LGETRERPNFHPCDRPFLCPLDLLSSGLRAVEIRRNPLMLANILLIIIALLLFGYLLLALLKPEKF
jgi:K+-transporting ATPase KdpF subunit